MLTYEDLLDVGESDADRGEFCKKAIRDFVSSREYKLAQDGERYYRKHNTTIEQYQKVLRTLSGKEVPDNFSSNHKTKSLFFHNRVIQQVQYVLGNGVTLSDPKNKEKLGMNFDFKLQTAAKRAMASSRAFGFWNYDHLEVFGYVDTPDEPGFLPLYSAESAEMGAGIRFWFRTIGNKQIARYTLYEPDGYTDYIDRGDKVEVLKDKQAYITTTLSTEAGGVEDVIGENLGVLPIVQMWANDTHDSELVGIKESIDCYDLIKNGLANDIDDLKEVYWILKNTGGMDDVDLAKFMQRIKTVHGAIVEDADAEMKAQEIPTEARTKMLEILRKDMFEDFGALDVSVLSAAAKTTQEIQAAYQAQDNKCADFEYYLTDFVQKILKLAGIDDNPTFVWNRVVNQAEQTTMVLQAANYLTDEIIVKKLPFLTPEEADQVIKDREAMNVSQFMNEGGEE